MKRLLSLLIVLLTFSSTNANAFFFFFIPGLGGGKSVNGDTCFGSNAKEGDTFTSASGNVATIIKLSGTSSACKTAEFPILATVDYRSSVTFKSNAGINLPDEFKPENLTDRQKYFEGLLLKAKNNANSTGVQISSIKRNIISDMMAYATKLKEGNGNSLDDVKKSEIETTTINGMNAWRYEYKGKLKNLFGTRYTYLTTILEGDHEVIVVSAWTPTSSYEKNGEELKQMAASITGIKTPIQSVSLPTSPPLPTTVESTSKVLAAVVDPTSSTLPPQIKSTADRLIDLKALYKDGVISKKNYEAKKKEILDSM